MVDLSVTGLAFWFVGMAVGGLAAGIVFRLSALEVRRKSEGRATEFL